MTAAESSPPGFSPRAAVTFSIVTAVAGIIIPPLPLIRRGAWGLALVAGVLWLGALYVFFAHFAGPGLLAHLGLWLLALIGLLAPCRLARIEARVRRLGRREDA